MRYCQAHQRSGTTNRKTLWQTNNLIGQTTTTKHCNYNNVLLSMTSVMVDWVIGLLPYHLFNLLCDYTRSRTVTHFTRQPLCIIARPRGSAYKRLCRSVCRSVRPSFPTPTRSGITRGPGLGLTDNDWLRIANVLILLNIDLLYYLKLHYRYVAQKDCLNASGVACRVLCTSDATYNQII